MIINARELAALTLRDVLFEGAYANLVLNQKLRQSDLDGRDRAFATNLVYGSLKRWNAVEYQINQYLKKPLKKKDAFLGILLHIAFFELLFTAAPSRAVVNEWVNMAKKHGHQGWGSLVNGLLRNAVRNADTLTWPTFADAIEKELFFQSLPSWLGELWRRERGSAETESLLKSFDRVRPLSFRVNALKTDRERFLDVLASCEIEATAGKYSPYCIKSAMGKQILNLPEYRLGECTVQEEGSQLAVLALQPQAGETVLDLCAAPGGKTAFMAQLMNDKGKIYAGDVHPHKIKLIEENAARLGITIIEAAVKDGALWGTTHPAAFDRVLLDAPCSGLGVLSRRQDARFHKAAADINALQKIQRKLIDSAVKALRPGGRMVFSTCTLTKAENEENRAYLLSAYPQMLPFDLEKALPSVLLSDAPNQGELTLLPHIHGTDGFYIAAFEKRKS